MGGHAFYETRTTVQELMFVIQHAIIVHVWPFHSDKLTWRFWSVWLGLVTVCSSTCIQLQLTSGASLN